MACARTCAPVCGRTRRRAGHESFESRGTMLMMSVRELSGRELVACRGVELAARRQKVDGVEVHTRHGKGERGASKGANRGASEVLAFTRRGRRARARRGCAWLTWPPTCLRGPNNLLRSLLSDLPRGPRCVWILRPHLLAAIRRAHAPPEPPSARPRTRRRRRVDLSQLAVCCSCACTSHCAHKVTRVCLLASCTRGLCPDSRFAGWPC